MLSAVSFFASSPIKNFCTRVVAAVVGAAVVVAAVVVAAVVVAAVVVAAVVVAAVVSDVVSDVAAVAVVASHSQKSF